jgi:hypothetical protein
LVTGVASPVLLTFAFTVVLASSVLARRVAEVLATHGIVGITRGALLATITVIFRRVTATSNGFGVVLVGAGTANAQRFAMAGSASRSATASVVAASSRSHTLSVLLVVTSLALGTSGASAVLDGITDALLGDLVEGSVAVTPLLEFGHREVMYSAESDLLSMFVEEAVRSQLQLVVRPVLQIPGAESEQPTSAIIRLGVVFGGLRGGRQYLLSFVVQVLQEEEADDQVSGFLCPVGRRGIASGGRHVELRGEPKLQVEVAVGVEFISLGRFYVTNERLVTTSHLEDKIKGVAEGLRRLGGKKRLRLLDGQPVLGESLVESNVDGLSEGKRAILLGNGVPGTFTEQGPRIGSSSSVGVHSQDEEAVERVVRQGHVQVGVVGDGEVDGVHEALFAGGVGGDIGVGEVGGQLEDFLGDDLGRKLVVSGADLCKLLFDIPDGGDGEAERELGATGPGRREIG